MTSDNLTSYISSLTSDQPIRWLITGGCGFIGTALIRRLRQERPQDQIRVLDNMLVGTRDDLAQVCDFIETSPPALSSHLSSLSSHNSVQLCIGDIKDPTACRQAAHDVDVIVHLAANTGVGPSVDDPVSDMQANVMGIVHMLEAARQNTDVRFVFASSGAPVGEVEPPIHEELAPHPVSPYGASKLAGEGYCSAYYRTFGVKTVALRFGNVYGPGSTHKSSVVAKFIRQAMQGETCEIYGDGSQTRDFIYIDDLTEAIFKAALFPVDVSNSSLTSHLSSLASSPWGQIFQIATSREHTVNEVAEKLGHVLQTKGIAMKIIHGQARLGDVKRNFSDTTKAKTQLGWQAEVDVDTGIQRTVDWFCSI
jgi:UDP-glucose 4-epimerase